MFQGERGDDGEGGPAVIIHLNVIAFEIIICVVLSASADCGSVFCLFGIRVPMEIQVNLVQLDCQENLEQM